jgi:hypothetical protein
VAEDAVKLGGNRIRTSGGRVLQFASRRKMQGWERVAQAIKHGWRPTRKGKK